MIDVESSSLMNEDNSDASVYLKRLKHRQPLLLKMEHEYPFDWFIGPADYKILKTYDENLSSLYPLVGGLLGGSIDFVLPVWIVGGFLPYGIACCDDDYYDWHSHR